MENKLLAAIHRAKRELKTGWDLVIHINNDSVDVFIFDAEKRMWRIDPADDDSISAWITKTLDAIK